MADFGILRKEYPEFHYDSYEITHNEKEIVLRFRFSMRDVFFEPTTKIKTENLKILNAFDSEDAKRIVFYLGMVEAVSYWKAACAPTVYIHCGQLSDSEIGWFKKLWYNGLGEFFYRNSIKTDFNDFVKFVSDGTNPESNCGFISSENNIIPVGGGKDSAVTIELLSEQKEKNMFFTVNDQPARTECVEAAGYDADRIIKTYRTIDRNLLELNKRGFLNGHTPFSAIVAFLSYYCAYLIGAKNIVLSNESSANEANVDGMQINHQYSKSYEFEKDFTDFTSSHFDFDIGYFSLLRAFNEAQIAKMFSHYPKYLNVFKSCNAGSKQNIWCGKCAKCLFVFIMLSPFVDAERLSEIFGGNMLDKPEMLNDFEGLCGVSGVKPFECVGTAREVRAMLELTLEKYSENKLPFLLKKYKDYEISVPENEIKTLFGELNPINGIPAELDFAVREMHKYVSNVD